MLVASRSTHALVPTMNRQTTSSSFLNIPNLGAVVGSLGGSFRKTSSLTSMEVLPRDDWFTVVDMEEGEALVAAIINEILLKSHDVLFEKHIEVQVLPYAVQFAKETLLSIIQWEFFKRDEGVIDSETWHPDEEPRPVMIDSWGRGVLPIVDRRPTKKVARKRVPSNAETQITYMSQRAEEKPKQVAPSPSPEPDVRVPAAAEPGTETIVRKGKGCGWRDRKSWELWGYQQRESWVHIPT
ncbi:hypothetical protein BJ742DRAFT_108246 [Cladochytrium replicatum]|nr:hypothetical protein BJ742DRAFT_108246 [Cladochytrium replicatum]